MIKATDLRIGNCLSFLGEWVYCNELSNDIEYAREIIGIRGFEPGSINEKRSPGEWGSQLSYIILTMDALNKIGELEHNPSIVPHSATFLFDAGPVQKIIRRPDGNVFLYTTFGTHQVYYLHEIQNIHFWLTGIELPILIDNL